MRLRSRLGTKNRMENKIKKMKTILIAILIFCSMTMVKGQCKTDSSKWVISDVFYKGDTTCTHDLVYSEEDFNNYGCLVMHGEGCWCPLEYKFRMAICKKCKYHIKEKYWHYQSSKPLSEYEKLTGKRQTIMFTTSVGMTMSHSSDTLVFTVK